VSVAVVTMCASRGSFPGRALAGGPTVAVHGLVRPLR
jgi:hypothetical protein